MDELKCEVCNKNLGTTKKSNAIYIQFRDYYDADENPIIKEYELCSTCADKVKDFLLSLGAQGYEV